MEKNTNSYIGSQFQKCLIIGGSGMLGYEIAAQLFNEGKDVRIFDLVRHMTVDLKNLSEI